MKEPVTRFWFDNTPEQGGKDDSGISGLPNPSQLAVIQNKIERMTLCGIGQTKGILVLSLPGICCGCEEGHHRHS